MKYIKCLAKRKLNNWIGKEWYHQRFDGAPYFMHLIAEAEIRKEPRKKGTDNDVHYCFYDFGKADWYILMDEIKRISDIIIKLGKKDPNVSEKFIKSWKKDQELFYKNCIVVGKTDLSKLSDRQIISMHDNFIELALNKNSSSSTIDGFALGTDELIAQKIKEVYDKSSIKDKYRYTELFSALTAPIHLSFINEAEVSLLKTALAIKKDPKKKHELLEKHQQSYFWISNNYVDANILDVKYFEDEIKRLYSLKIDLADHLKKINDTPKTSKKRKDELMKVLKIDKDLKFLIKVSEDFTYWQDERKRSTFWNAHYLSLILKEVSKRTKIPLDELKYMSPREMSTVFSNPPMREELRLRRDNGVFYWDKEGHEAVGGEEATLIKKSILGDKDLSDINDFRGLTACTGKAVGKVKVLKSAKEISKVEKGDILVAVMTRPDYIPAMRKASAIVTDEGGVTSHAAIVSREIGIPCIIGTKIATKVLKDGMLVEVNANHGWVKIIKKA